MSLSFDIQIDKASLAGVKKKILNSAFNKLEKINFTTTMPSAIKWLNFVSSDTFAGEFGVKPSVAKGISSSFLKIMSTPLIKINGDSIIIKYLNIDNLRQVSTVQWTSKKKSTITVNAIDVYEFGTMPTIPNYKFVAGVGEGRSRLGHMEESNSSFSFFGSRAIPEPGELRLGAEIFAQIMLVKFTSGAL